MSDRCVFYISHGKGDLYEFCFCNKKHKSYRMMCLGSFSFVLYQLSSYKILFLFTKLIIQVKTIYLYLPKCQITLLQGFIVVQFMTYVDLRSLVRVRKRSKKKTLYRGKMGEISGGATEEGCAIDAACKIQEYAAYSDSISDTLVT